jgi:hypothetical protein
VVEAKASFSRTNNVKYVGHHDISFGEAGYSVVCLFGIGRNMSLRVPS